MTNQQGVPEALRLADALDLYATGDEHQRDIEDAAAELRHLHYENERLAALVEAQQPTTHVQNPAEIEHVAGDVSKNGAESNMAQQTAPSAACPVDNNNFDHQTAADVLNGKTVSDEVMRKFVAVARWAHDDRVELRATLLSVRGELASREAEIALLKKALMDAEAPQPSPTPQAAPAGMDMQDAYVGAREDLAIWKRRALVAERDLRAERETASRLAAEINATNGPTRMGEPVTTAQPAPAATPQADSQPAHQRGTGYPPLPATYYLAGGVVRTWDEGQMRAYADETYALRIGAKYA